MISRGDSAWLLISLLISILSVSVGASYAVCECMSTQLASPCSDYNFTLILTECPVCSSACINTNNTKYNENSKIEPSCLPLEYKNCTTYTLDLDLDDLDDIGDGLSGGAIAGIVIGAVVFASCACGAVYYCIWGRERKAEIDASLVTSTGSAA